MFDLLLRHARLVDDTVSDIAVKDGKIAALGKETIDSYNTGESRGREVSHSLNYQKLGKDMPYLLMKSSVALNFT